MWKRRIHLLYLRGRFFLGTNRRRLIRWMRILRAEGIDGAWLRLRERIARPGEDPYETWLRRNRLTAKERERIRREVERLPDPPVFSILVPVCDPEEAWLRKCLDSVRNQLYPHWELCIADDASRRPHVRRILEEYAAKEPRIKTAFRKTNGHISACSNTALAMAAGTFSVLLDHDDELSPDALFENARLLACHPETDMVYSDEDKISETGRRYDPFFKPDWSPDTLLSMMYTCHLGVYRTALLREIGGFREGFEGSQDYDLVLRLTEKTDRIRHIPKVLYHWRAVPQSSASDFRVKGYAQKSALRAVGEALARRGENATVEPAGAGPGRYRVRYRPRDGSLVSIVIPTRDLPDVLGVCLTSLFTKTQGPPFEVVLVDNGSRQTETQDLFRAWRGREPDRFRVVAADMPFNFSRLVNIGAAAARGNLLLILNNDVEILEKDWLCEMAGQAGRPSVGAVGAKLLYPDGTIQHAGVVLGIGGVAGHSHKYFPEGSPGYFDRLRITSNYAAVTGACLMVKKALFAQVAGFDEALGVAFNDIDFCLKLLCRGLFNVQLGHVALRHHESRSRGLEDTVDKQIRFRGEIDLMQARWKDLLAGDPFYSPHLSLVKEDFSYRLRDPGWLHETPGFRHV